MLSRDVSSYLSAARELERFVRRRIRWHSQPHSLHTSTRRRRRCRLPCLRVGCSTRRLVYELARELCAMRVPCKEYAPCDGDLDQRQTARNWSTTTRRCARQAHCPRTAGKRWPAVQSQEYS